MRKRQVGSGNVKKRQRGSVGVRPCFLSFKKVIKKFEKSLKGKELMKNFGKKPLKSINKKIIEQEKKNVLTTLRLAFAF